MKVHADAEVCVGSGLCVLRAPEVFDQGDDGRVVVLLQPGPDEEATALEAVGNCPVAALRVDR